MTEPPTAPRTKLDEARDALHAALADAMAVCGWTGRADRFPPRQITAPYGWVDVPTMGNSTQENVPAGTIAATFPVAITVDGAPREQVEQLDAFMAHAWAALDGVERARVLSAGPQFLELPSGQETRAVVFSVQVTLLARTLCNSTLTASHDTAPPAS